MEAVARGRGIDGVSCQHLQVLMTQLLQKHLKWQEDRRKDVWHDSEKYFRAMQINPIKQPVSHCWTRAFDYHLNWGFNVLNDVQDGTKSRRSHVR